MQKASVTALVCAFARAYHSQNHNPTVYDDPLALHLLGQEEYANMCRMIGGGIAYFNPDFIGSEEKALRWIVDQQLSPPLLGRSAFLERALRQAREWSTAQYLCLAAGYDTFALRQPPWAERLEIWEIDHPATARDKQARLNAAGIAVPGNVHFLPADLSEPDWQQSLLAEPCFRRESISFFSLLGICHYLAEETFRVLLRTLADVSPRGSRVAFDYPDEHMLTRQADTLAQRHAEMAASAGEPMLAGYACGQMERLLEDCGYQVCEHLRPSQITEQFFARHNAADPAHAMAAFGNANYCLAIQA